MVMPTFIMSARHKMPNVRTADDYRARQRQQIRNLRKAYPNLEFRDPWETSAQLPIFVSGGKWCVECACGNCPIVAPEWQNLACCYDCGAVYVGLQMPAEAADIERLLVARPVLGHRYWNPMMTLDDLRDTNRAMGVEAA